MKSISVSGQKRENVGKTASRQLRSEGHVPCELYGKNGNVHFTIFSPDFKDLVYTPEKYRVQLSIDGAQYEAVMREIQFHPLNEEILHVDFHEIDESKKIKLDLPIRFSGTAAGAREGGKFVKKLRTLTVKGFPKDMPDAITVDISNLGLGKSIKVKDIQVENLEISNSASLPVATVEVPRGLKGQAEEAATPGKKK